MKKQELFCCLQNIPANASCFYVVGTALLITNSGRFSVSLPPSTRIHINKLWMFQYLLHVEDKDGVWSTHTPSIHNLLNTTPSPGSHNSHMLRQFSLSPSLTGQIKKLYSTSSVLTSAEHSKQECPQVFQLLSKWMCSSVPDWENLGWEHQIGQRVWIPRPLSCMSQKIWQIMQLQQASLFACKYSTTLHCEGFMRTTAVKHSSTSDNPAVKNYTKYIKDKLDKTWDRQLHFFLSFLPQPVDRSTSTVAAA